MSRFVKRPTPSKENDIKATFMVLPSKTTSPKNLKRVVEYPPRKPVHDRRASIGTLAVLRIRSDLSDIS